MAKWESATHERDNLILKILQPAPRYKTCKEIIRDLEDQGYELSDRQAQRLMNFFAENKGLEVRTRPGERGNPKEFAWPAGSGAPQIGAIEPPAALTYQLAMELLAPLLPESFLAGMKRDFQRVKNVLGQIGTTGKQLPQKVRVFPRGRGRLPAHVDQKLLTHLFNAVVGEKQIRVEYLAQTKSKPNRSVHTLNPLGLVFRFDSFYLVHVREPKKPSEDADKVMEWPVHRMQSLEALSTPARSPANFDLDAYLENPGFLKNQFLTRLNALGPTIRLKLIFNEVTARYVMERPFSKDQSHKTLKDGRVQVEATVSNTRELLTDLHDFAADVEVVEPAPLRAYFADLAEELSKTYSAS